MKLFNKKIEISESQIELYDLLNIVLTFSNKNIVKIFAFQIQEGSCLLEMGFCEYYSLREILNQRDVDIEFINLLIKDVLNGLAYLHDQGFVHSDLKLSNVLLAKENEHLVFKLGDLDTIRPNPSLFTLQGFYTPEILGPECYSEGKIDDKTDIWSFGVMLFRIFTGDYPFGHRDNFTFEEIRENVKKNSFQTFKIQDIPAPYSTLIDACLEPDFRNRPSALELMEWLDFSE